MDQVRVAFDVGPLQGHRTGIGHAVAALHDALREQEGVEVQPYVLSRRSRPEPPVVRLPLPAAVAHRAWRAPTWALWRRPVDRWLPPTDVVHGTNYVVPPSRYPAVVSVYDCWFLRHPGQASTAVRRAGRVLAASIRHGAVVHTSSFATEVALRQHFPAADVRTIHLGALPLPPAGPPLPGLAGVPYVLALGTVERRKNLPRLVAAFGAVSALVPDLQLVLAGGDGDDSQPVRDAIGRLSPHTAAKVRCTGRVDEPTRGWLLRNARVLAYPSLDEGFGFPLLDAMQARVPVVASDAGSIPEVAGAAALVVPPQDVDALADALQRAATDDTTRSMLLAAGDARWPQFTWAATGERMAVLYHELSAVGRRTEGSRG